MTQAELDATIQRKLDLILAKLSPADRTRYDVLIAGGCSPLEALCKIEEYNQLDRLRTR